MEGSIRYRDERCIARYIKYSGLSRRERSYSCTCRMAGEARSDEQLRRSTAFAAKGEAPRNWNIH